MTRYCGEFVLVEHDNDVNWSANENPLPTKNKKKCRTSTKCFHISNSTIAVCSFLVLFSFVSLTIYFGLRQHMSGPELTWSKVMVNATKNATATQVQLPYRVSHHSWQHNKLILRVWMGTCLAVGLFIVFTLLILVCSFLWKRHKQTLKRHTGKLQKNATEYEDITEMKETVLAHCPSTEKQVYNQNK